MSKKQSFLFSVGNSNDGPIGFCARVTASSKKLALEKLRVTIPEELELVSFVDNDEGSEHAKVEYFNIYINPGAVTIKDIEESETEEIDE